MSVLRSKYPDLQIPDNISWPDFVLSKFGNYGDRTAIVDGESGRSLSYNEIKDLTHRFSSALARRGFQKGDVMAIYLPNVIEYPIIFHGVARLGGVNTTINPQYSPQDLARQLTSSRAKYLITMPSLAERAFRAGVLKELRSVIVIGKSQGCESIASLLLDDGTAFPSNVKINPKEDPVSLPFSSGTTGISKGVVITHYNQVAQLCLLTRDGPSPVIRTWLNVLPFFHTYGLTIVMGLALYSGDKVVILTRFDPEIFLRTIQDYKVAIAPLVPPLVLFLSKHPMVDKYDLSSLRVISSGAAPLGGDLEMNAAKRIPSAPLVRQGYGMTELTCSSHGFGSREKHKVGSIGRLLPNLECKVIDPGSGNILGPNQDGEICIKGPIVMKGYLNNPEATARTIDADGWLHTGDIGHYDEDDYFFIVDRLKELIKYKGFQVPPAELEALLLSHPNVSDVAVIGIPDLASGELPKAFVVRRGDVTSEELKQFVASKVPPEKKLRGGVEFVEKIPKSASGKILRRLLRKPEQQKSRL